MQQQRDGLVAAGVVVKVKGCEDDCTPTNVSDTVTYRNGPSPWARLCRVQQVAAPDRRFPLGD